MYLRLLIFLPTILIPAYASSSLAFCMIYAEYKLNKQGDNTCLYVHTALTYSFPNLKPVYCSMPNSNYCFLTWIQISQEIDQVVWYAHLFKPFPQFAMIHIVKGFSLSQWIRCFSAIFLFFLWSSRCWQLISGSSAFLNPAWTSGSSWFTSCWSLAWRILRIILLACKMSAIVQ